MRVCILRIAVVGHEWLEPLCIRARTPCTPKFHFPNLLPVGRNRPSDLFGTCNYSSHLLEFPICRRLPVSEVTWPSAFLRVVGSDIPNRRPARIRWRAFGARLNRVFATRVRVISRPRFLTGKVSTIFLISCLVVCISICIPFVIGFHVFHVLQVLSDRACLAFPPC